MCTWITVSCVAVTAIVGTSVSAAQGAEAADKAEKQAAQQKTFEEKQLKLQKNDNARQAILQRNQLRKQRAQVMTSVSLNNVLADRSSEQAAKLRRENATSGAGVESKRTSMPSRHAYNYGTTH